MTDYLSSESLLVFFGTYGVRVLGVVLVFSLTWILASMVQRWITQTLKRAKFDVTVALFFANLARWALITAASIGCLGVFGVETSSFAAVLGATGLALGLAFQGTLSNFAAGVMLLIFRPFNVGQTICVAGYTGVVVEIELFITELCTPDNVKLTIPNSAVFGATIVNYSHHPHRRVDVDLGTDYSADIDHTREVLLKSMENIPKSLTTPSPTVFLKGLGDSCVDWQLRIFCKPEDYWDVYQDTIRAAKIGLDNAEINIPFPRVDVSLNEPV